MSAPAGYGQWASAPPPGAAGFAPGGVAEQWTPGPPPAGLPPLARSPWEILQLAPRPVALLAPEERRQFFDLLADIAWGGDVGAQPVSQSSREFSFAYGAPPPYPSNTAGPPGPPGPDVAGSGPAGVDDPSSGWPAQGETWPVQEQNAAAWPEDQWTMAEDRPAEKKSSRRHRHHHDKGEAPDGHRKHRSERKGGSPRTRSRGFDAGAADRGTEMARGAARSSAAQASAAKDKTKDFADATAQRFNQRLEEAQQRVAQTAVNNYARQATGGVVTNVPAPVSNAALNYAKKNPKEAMKFAKFLT